uniref:CACTA en-spm transposon protein n=1 Tax=Cucumis melo TaxID=3656 RepID=A0A9I9EGI9_CUCME
MTIAPNVEKPIFPYVVGFSQGIGVDVGREYIEVVKADLQRFFVLDFNNQAINRFVEHQVLSTFKEFWDDCHRHFKKYTNPEEARANPSNLLSQPTSEGSQPLSEDEICYQVLGRRPGLKALVGEPSRKPARRQVRAVPRRHCRMAYEAR